MRSPVPPVECVDGFRVSIQVGQHNYSTPREDQGPWAEVEIGFPTEPVKAWAEYADDPDHLPDSSVYGYVPIALVVDALNAHGGPSSDWMAKYAEGTL